MRDAALAIVGITKKYIEAIYHHAGVADLMLQEYQLPPLWRSQLN